MRSVSVRLTGALLLLAASVAVRAQSGAWDFHLPPGFPTPRIPADNPLTADKIELGRYLFYDTRLSENRTQSCASCHQQARAFTDGRGRAVGSTGQVHPRGSMSLVNVGYASVLTWGNPTIHRLEDQARIPMFGTDPVELGLSVSGATLVRRLEDTPAYGRLFVAAFPGDARPITVDHVTQALASFERTIISAQAPYDRYHYERVDDAISPAAKRGEVLFFSQPLSCFQCHSGFNFSGAVETAGGGPRRAEFHNTGLYNLSGALSYPSPNTGAYEVTHRPKDIGKFKAPTLRNITVTAPYMHDGSIATLAEVLDHYAAGGRTIAGGPYAGVGHDNPNKSPTVRGFALTPDQRADLLAFLGTLTDERLLADARLANPWPAAARPDFSGAWKAGPARATATGGGQGGGRGTGGGLGLGPSADALTVRQDTQALTIEEHRGTVTTRVTYRLDGQAATNPLPVGRNAGAMAESISHWTDDRLVTAITVLPLAGDGAVIHYLETRYLDRAGALVVETTLPPQANARTVVYVRQRDR